MKDNGAGRELARTTGSPALGTAALALSVFSCSDPLPFKTRVWREEGRTEQAGGSQIPLFFCLGFFPSYLNVSDLIDSCPLLINNVIVP